MFIHPLFYPECRHICNLILRLFQQDMTLPCWDCSTNVRLDKLMQSCVCCPSRSQRRCPTRCQHLFADVGTTSNCEIIVADLGNVLDPGFVDEKFTDDITIFKCYLGTSSSDVALDDFATVQKFVAQACAKIHTLLCARSFFTTRQLVNLFKMHVLPIIESKTSALYSASAS